jgi:PAS domain S-box-containing protein
LRLELRTALYQAAQRQTNVEARNLKFRADDHTESVNIYVRPVLREDDTARGFILVLFEPSAGAASDEEKVFTSDEPMARQLEEELMRLKRLQAIEREVRATDGRDFLMRLLPYRTADDRIQGVVVTFVEITERKRAEAAVAADLRDTQLLHELATRLATEENIQTLYSEIMAAAITLMRADAGTVQILDEPTRELLLLATQGFERAMTGHFYRVGASSNTPCGVALATGERTFVDFDAPPEQNPDGSMRMHVEAGYPSAQSTPLVARSGKAIGMVSTHWREAKHRPTERELRLLDPLARQAADLIEQRQTEERLRRAAEMDAFRVTLNDALRLLSDALEIQAEACRLLGEHLSVDRTYYVEVNEAEGYARVERDYVRGDSPSLVGAFRVEDYGWIIPLLRRGEIAVVADAQTSDIVPDTDRQAIGAVKIRARISAPLVKAGELVGALCVTEPATRDWTNAEVELVRETAERIYSTVERARAEEALRESEERLRIATTAARMYSWEFDAATETYKFSDNAAEILGVAPNRLPLPREDTFILAHPDDRVIVERELREALETGKGFSAKIRSRKETGEIVWLNVETAVVEDGGKKTSRVIGIAQDITERRRIEAALQEAQALRLVEEQAARQAAEDATRAKDEFLAVVSHELRSPLNAILGYARMLRTQRKDDPELRKITEIIERSGRAQIQLIEDLLDTARIISGKLRLEVGPVELTAVVAAALDTLRPAAEAKGIELRMEDGGSKMEDRSSILHPPSSFQVTGDADRLQQVVWNLLSNAIKFTPEGGRVGVTLSRAEGGVQHRDAGCGRLRVAAARARARRRAGARHPGGGADGPRAVGRSVQGLAGGLPDARLQAGGGRGANHGHRQPDREAGAEVSLRHKLLCPTRHHLLHPCNRLLDCFERIRI